MTPPQSQATGVLRFELSSHSDFGYRVSVPSLLCGGGRLAVREDVVCEADIRAVADWVAGILPFPPGSTVEENWCTAEDWARQILGSVLGPSEKGHGS